jgi:hydrogenase/urease accessory protein HupE
VRSSCGAYVQLLLGAALSLSPACALAHATQLSSSTIELHGNDAAVRVEVNGADVDAALKTAIANDGRIVASDALARTKDVIAAYVLERARILNASGAPCQGRSQQIEARAEHIVLDLRWSCPPMTGTLAYEVTLFQDIDPAARHMVTVAGDTTRMGLLGVSNTRLPLAPARAQLPEVLRHYLIAGIEHIVIGYDHIAFLVAVIAWGRRLWPLVAVVTAFTLAHSVTLTLAVLGVLSPPARLVETLIALSIVYVAAENFFVHDLRRRWVVTFGFGLVHGFGFAGALRDYGLPPDALAWALGAFNAGVEVGQVAVVAVALALLHILEVGLRTVAGKPVSLPDPRLVGLVSAVVLMLGLYWTAARLLS